MLINKHWHKIKSFKMLLFNKNNISPNSNNKRGNRNNSFFSKMCVNDTISSSSPGCPLTSRILLSSKRICQQQTTLCNNNNNNINNNSNQMKQQSVFSSTTSPSSSSSPFRLHSRQRNLLIGLILTLLLCIQVSNNNNCFTSFILYVFEINSDANITFFCSNTNENLLNREY